MEGGRLCAVLLNVGARYFVEGQYPSPHEFRDGNGNGVDDRCDIAVGTSFDCSANGVPDECEGDCNGDGVADTCELFSRVAVDCNANGRIGGCQGSVGIKRPRRRCEPAQARW